MPDDGSDADRTVTNPSDYLQVTSWLAAAVQIASAAAGVCRAVSATNTSKRRRGTVAKSADRTKSSFLATMNRELHTPLSAVIRDSEKMEQEVEDLGETGLLTDPGKITRLEATWHIACLA